MGNAGKQEAEAIAYSTGSFGFISFFVICNGDRLGYLTVTMP